MEIAVPLDPHALKLYTDGSCLMHSGRSGGISVWVEYPCSWNRPDEELVQIGYEESTNNRMELEACIWAHRWILDNAPGLKVSRIQVVTDSQYIRDNLHRAPYWRNNKWRNLQGRPIENVDLWKELLSVRSRVRLRVDVVWTLGKQNAILKAVDKSAKLAAKGYPAATDFGLRSGKIGRSKNAVKGAAPLYNAAGQEERIRVYQSIAQRGEENKVKFQVFDETRGDFFEKYTAYTTPDNGALLHRGHNYRVRFNRNANYPQIEVVLAEG